MITGALRAIYTARGTPPAGSGTPVKQFPSFRNAIPAALAWQATYSWPFNMTCAGKGGWPDILIVTWPKTRSMMWNE